MIHLRSSALLTLCAAALATAQSAQPTPPRNGETSGQADVALQGYYLGGSQSLSDTTGFSIHFTDFLPKVGLLSGTLESYGADGRYRLGDNSVTLGGAVWQGRRWNVTGGDFRLFPNTVESPFTNLVNSEVSGRGVKIESFTRNRSITFFAGEVTLLSGPRVPFRVSAGQFMVGLTAQQKVGKRLTLGARVMRLSTSATSIAEGAGLLPANRQFQTVDTMNTQAAFALTPRLKLYGEAGLSFTSAFIDAAGANSGGAATGGSVPLSVLGGISFDTAAFTARANYVSQGAAYLPTAGQFAGDRRGPFAELRYRPLRGVELYGSASQYRNNLEDRADVPTFHSTSLSAGASLSLPWKFNLSGQISQLNYNSAANDAISGVLTQEDSNNRQISLGLSRSFGRQQIRVTVRDLLLNGSSFQRQRSEEVEDSLNWRRFTVSGAARKQTTISTEQRDTMFYRGSMQARFRRFSAFAQVEIGNDLVNQTVFSTSSYATTVFGMNAELPAKWNLQMEAFRNRMNLSVNPENIFLLANQGTGLATTLSGLDQWSIFVRVTRQVHWGAALPHGASSLDEFARSQIPVTGSIEGLISELTSAGLRRVEGIPVCLDNGRTVLSDAEGHYRIPDVPEGPHKITLAVNELPAEFNPGPVAAADTQVLARRLSRVDLQVVRLGAIAGHVDAPLKGENNDVETVVIRVEPGGRYTTPDFDGNFAFYNLPEGEYRVSIDAASLPQFAQIEGPAEVKVEVRTSENPPIVRFGYTIKIPDKPVRQIKVLGQQN